MGNERALFKLARALAIPPRALSAWALSLKGDLLGARNALSSRLLARAFSFSPCRGVTSVELPSLTSLQRAVEAVELVPSTSFESALPPDLGLLASSR